MDQKGGSSSTPEEEEEEEAAGKEGRVKRRPSLLSYIMGGTSDATTAADTGR